MKLVERPDYIEWLESYPQTDLVKVLVGQRRVGKSTLLRMYAEKLKKSGQDINVIEQNFEDPYVLRDGNWRTVFDTIMPLISRDKPNVLFLDEVQEIDDFQRLVNGLRVQGNINIYLTGSNSKLVSGELATLLTGRQVQLEVMPFNFEEYVTFTNSDNSNIYESFRNFIYSGSIPGCLEAKNTGSDATALNLANSILETIIEKDIFSRYEVYTKSEFYRILDFILDSIGSECSPNNIANKLQAEGVKIDSKTVTRYLNILESAFLITKVNRFDIKGKEILKTLSKYYINDPVFRQVRLGRTPLQDTGHLLENAVYNYLKRFRKKVWVGKVGSKEVDFVVENNQGYTEYYQVTLSTEDAQTRERELKPLKAIKDSNLKFLVTLDRDNNPVYDGIRKINAVDMMMPRE
jgi:predicted AAA+ superfamily ATPase